jgi:hypothetical protein
MNTTEPTQQAASQSAITLTTQRERAAFRLRTMPGRSGVMP